MNKLENLYEISSSEILESSTGMLRLDAERRGIDANAKSFVVTPKSPIGVFTLGTIPPIAPNIAFGKSLTVWNFHVAREGSLVDNVSELFRAIENYARDHNYESIFILGNLNLIVSARANGYVVRDGSNPDIKYITKRL